MFIEFLRVHCIEVCLVTVPLLLGAAVLGLWFRGALLVSGVAYGLFLFHALTRGMPIPVALWGFFVVCGAFQLSLVLRSMKVD
jgi:hypothetical protein